MVKKALTQYVYDVQTLYIIKKGMSYRQALGQTTGKKPLSTKNIVLIRVLINTGGLGHAKPVGPHMFILKR